MSAVSVSLVAENLSWFCPTTNHYVCEDGTYLLVTVPRFDVAAMIEAKTGLRIPISLSHIPTQAYVFLADENAVVLDADGDPANGLTPIVRVEDCETFEAALSAAGFTLMEGT